MLSFLLLLFLAKKIPKSNENIRFFTEEDKTMKSEITNKRIYKVGAPLQPPKQQKRIKSAFYTKYEKKKEPELKDSSKSTFTMRRIDKSEIKLSGIEKLAKASVTTSIIAPLLAISACFLILYMYYIIPCIENHREQRQKALAANQLNDRLNQDDNSDTNIKPGRDDKKLEDINDENQEIGPNGN